MAAFLNLNDRSKVTAVAAPGRDESMADRTRQRPRAARPGHYRPVEPDSQLSRNQTFVTVKPPLREANALMDPLR
jgi:hypothetical protein